VNAPDLISRNRLLAVLSPADRELITPALEAVEIDVRQILEAPGEPIAHVYFVESGLVSVVGETSKGHRIEVGMIGSEGMTGLAVVLADGRSRNQTIVQSAGSAMRLSARSLAEAVAASQTLTSAILRYAHVLMLQNTQTALANGRGRLDERLARWLLMWHDRMERDTLTITHEFLALLLGVRRPGVTDALHVLEGKGLIRTTRSRVHIRDRSGLQLAANGFYGMPEAEYDRLMRSARAQGAIALGS
jgi:CRP-like cAMP-binding protein